MQMQPNAKTRGLLTTCGIIAGIATPLALAGPASATSMGTANFAFAGSLQGTMTARYDSLACEREQGFDGQLTGQVKFAVQGANTVVLNVPSSTFGTTTNVSGDNLVTLSVSSGSTDYLWMSARGFAHQPRPIWSSKCHDGAGT